MNAEYRTKAAVEASAKKRTAEGRVKMNCAVCGKPMERWKSQVAKAKLPMTCGPTCRSKGMTGAGNPRWKNGAWMDGRGNYRYLRVDVLSKADKALLANPKARQVLEHRLVMARVVGRPLKPTEMVHHINGVKSDNRPENLHLTNWSEHSKEHRLLEREVAELRAEVARLKALLAAGPQI